MSSSASRSEGLRLLFEDERFEEGAVVGTVEIMDEAQVRCSTHILLANRPVYVDLPHAGLFAARGWLADGDNVGALIRSGAATASLRRSGPDRAGSAVEASQLLWARAWRSEPGGWVPWPARARVGAARALSVAGSGRSEIVQYGVQGSAPVMITAFDDITFRLERSADGGMVPVPEASLVRTLAAQLYQGAFVLAGPLVARIQHDAEHDVHIEDLDSAFLVGYFLLQHGVYEDLRRWLSGPAQRWSDTPDHAVLRARLSDFERSESRARSQHPHAAATESYVHAAKLGLPRYSFGVRLLADGLAIAQHGDDSAAAEYQRLRSYRRCLLPTALTCFYGAEPAKPSAMPVPIPVPSDATYLQVQPPGAFRERGVSPITRLLMSRRPSQQRPETRGTQARPRLFFAPVLGLPTMADENPPQRAGLLQLPAELLDLLGPNAIATAALGEDVCNVVIARVYREVLESALVFASAPAASELHLFDRVGSILRVSLPWAIAVLPQQIGLSIVSTIGPSDERDR